METVTNNNSEKKILSRGEVEERLTWDLSHIYATVEDFYKDLSEAEKMVSDFSDSYKGKLNEPSVIVNGVKAFEKVSIKLDKLGNYASLKVSEDRTNAENMKLYLTLQSKLSPLLGSLAFFNNEILANSEETIKKAMDEDENYSYFLKDLLRFKPHMLSDETEKVLATLQETFDVPYNIYETAKLSDMKFPEFTVDGVKYPLTFVNFEGEYEYNKDPKVRREAFKTFSQKLAEYKETIGAAYAAQIRNEKLESQIRGYDSVFDFLLMKHKVTREMYDRQLDVIMEELAPHMRRYAKLLKKAHGLEKMMYPDLKIDLDPDFEPEINVDGSKEYVMNALGVLGEDYRDMVKTAMEERWIDFVQNIGKSTGAFCASPPEVHPYILISWTERMREVFVLAHELGHAGHTVLTSKNQIYLNDNLSMYAIEAPSTMNEMLMADYLLKTNKDTRFQRWVISSIISRTYFHNFVTHFLEGYYQRELYKIIDEGGALGAEDFSRIFKETLVKFWGEDIELTEGAELTWMRQPHYYMGLYPYTYSAGLTISTGILGRIQKEGQPAIDDLRKILSMGGINDPLNFAKAAGIDISTDKALKDTVVHIGSLIDELYKLTEELGR